MRNLLMLSILASVGCSASDVAKAITPQPFALSITPAQSATGVRSVVSGQTRVTCPVDISASASGGPSGEYAYWSVGDGAVRLTSTGQTTSVILTGGELVGYFGSDRVATGTSAAMHSSVVNTGPFTFSLTLHYIVASTLEQRASTYNLTCL